MAFAKKWTTVQGTLSGGQDSTTIPGGTSGLSSLCTSDVTIAEVNIFDHYALKDTLTVVNEYSPAAWSSCGGSQVVNINTALRASNFRDKSASGYIKTKGSVVCNPFSLLVSRVPTKVSFLPCKIGHEHRLEEVLNILLNIFSMN